jgi:Raf kinase inhibitor-like YbhB/YbcL family protein
MHVAALERMRTLLGLSIVLAASVAQAQPAKLTVSSNAFDPSSGIPVQYTCDGAGEAPTLRWFDVPAGTRSIAILVDDPDAQRGPFTHLLVTNLPPSLTSLDLGAALPAGALASRNDAGTPGYLAPCPANGVHHYHFRVYALNARHRPPAGNRYVTRDAFLRGLQGHVLAEGELTAVYGPRQARR